jgi:hypothetical protein
LGDLAGLGTCFRAAERNGMNGASQMDNFRWMPRFWMLTLMSLVNLVGFAFAATNAVHEGKGHILRPVLLAVVTVGSWWTYVRQQRRLEHSLDRIDTDLMEQVSSDTFNQCFALTVVFGLILFGWRLEI